LMEWQMHGGENNGHVDSALRGPPSEGEELQEKFSNGYEEEHEEENEEQDEKADQEHERDTPGSEKQQTK
ncbi:Amino-acid acetyltransferase, mitochondrial, partial [Ascosphaera pollenicola]